VKIHIPEYSIKKKALCQALFAL